MVSKTFLGLCSAALIPSSLVVSAVWAPSSEAAVILSDGFGDGDYNNDAASDSGGVVDDALDVGSTFYRARAFSSTLASLVTDNGVGGIGSGLALKFEPSSTGQRFLTVGFADTTLSNIGDSLTVSFDIRLDASVDSDRRLRFGLHNDNGTPITADGDANIGVTDNDEGVFVQVDTGTPDATVVDIRYEPAGDIINGGSGNTFLGGSTDAAAAIDATAKNVALTITTVAFDLLELSYSVDGVDYLVALTSAGSGVASPNLTFNQFSIGTSVDVDFLIDNVQIEHVVPEPSALSLMALGSFCAFYRRR